MYVFDDFKDGNVETEIESGMGAIYKLPVKALNIIWGNDTRFWRFQNLPEDETREIGFKEGAWLVQVNWIEVTARVRKAELYNNRANSLSPKTSYDIYYVIKFRADAFGWHSVPIKFKVRVTTTSKSDLNHDNTIIIEEEDEKTLNLESFREKQDSWHEIPGGSFSVCNNSDGFVEFGMFEVNTAWWKGNMVLAGVKIKPSPQA